MPNLSSKSRHLVPGRGKSARESVEAGGGTVVYVGREHVYFEIRLEDALLCDALPLAGYDGGRHRYLAHRLLSFQAGHHYCDRDVDRVAAEVERLEGLLAGEREAKAKKTPGEKKEKKPRVRKVK